MGLDAHSLRRFWLYRPPPVAPACCLPRAVAGDEADPFKVAAIRLLFLTGARLQISTGHNPTFTTSALRYSADIFTWLNV